MRDEKSKALSLHVRHHEGLFGAFRFALEWIANRMAFLKRKRVKFSVDVQVCHLSDVPLINAVLFVKLRLLDGGTFEGHTEKAEVGNHSVSWTKRFNFMCRIGSDPETGILERCLCRVSVRKEQKGGKTFEKVGYVDVNLSEFAASGVEGMSRSYLLDGYGPNQRLDNSRVTLKVTMCHHSADPFFKVPHYVNGFGSSREVEVDKTLLNPIGRKAPDPSSSDDEKPPVTFREPVPTVSSELEDGRRSGALRRLSQDRSLPQRVQNSRMDAELVVDDILKGTRLSDEGSSEGSLALYVSQDGEARLSTAPLPQRLFQKVQIADSPQTK